MKKIYLILLLSFAIFSCDDFVSDYEKPNDSIGDDQFKTAKDAQFLVKGVKGLFAETYDQMTSMAGGLSDEMNFTRDIQGASFVQFDQIDRATTEAPLPLTPINNSIANGFKALQEFRKHTELLISKCENDIVFNEGEEGIKTDALYNGYFYSAVAKYFLGAYFGLETNSPGATIDVSPLIPRDELYNMAITDLTTAEAYASEAQLRTINTFKARIYMLLNNSTMAATALSAGMMQGDANVNALYNALALNDWYFDSGNGRIQWYTNPRYEGYLALDPDESVRIPLFTVPGTAKDSTGAPIRVYSVQNKFPETESSIRFLGWQENELLLAEIAIAGGDVGTGLTHINNVRTSYNLASVDEQYITDNYAGDAVAFLIAERDKEFFCEGMRLIDQRHFNVWHLDPATSWMHLPLPLAERQANPNL